MAIPTRAPRRAAAALRAARPETARRVALPLPQAHAAVVSKADVSTDLHDGRNPRRKAHRLLSVHGVGVQLDGAQQLHEHVHVQG